MFLLCTFWLVEVLTMQGRTDEARDLFERVVATGNDVGLFAEEYDVEREEMVGNFPQAFTHLGLIAADARLRQAADS
jgi:GH15 family glucan-1,4-alpha-glucosidase